MTKKLQLKKNTSQVDTLLNGLVEQQEKLSKLPPLSTVEKAKFDYSIAIDHLYYSSKIEGSILTKKGIDNAINDTGIPTTKG